MMVGDLLAAEIENWVRFASGVKPQLEYVPNVRFFGLLAPLAP